MFANAIFNAKSINELWMESFTYDEGARVSYITENINKYLSEKIKNGNYEMVLSVAYQSPNNPLRGEEKMKLNTVMQTAFISKRTEFWVSASDELVDELAVQLIFIK